MMKRLEEEEALIERERKFKKLHLRRLKLLKLRANYEREIGPPDADEVDIDRLADITDFDYRFQFRDELPARVRHRLEIAAAKLEWKKRDGTPGFFADLVKHRIDWKSEISVVSSILQEWAEKVVNCGLWARGRGHPKNSGRCHLHDHCRLCSWIDHGSVLKSALGVETGTYHRGIAAHLRWFAVHLSVRDCAGNAVAVGRDIRPDDWDVLSESGVFAGAYDPRPVRLQREEGDDMGGIDTCRYVSLAAQSALKSLHKSGSLHGFRSKAETALDLMPVRGLPHVHAIANGPDDNAQHLAEELKARMDEALQRYAGRMQLPLYASVRVFRLPSPEDLERAALYMEKPIPLGELVKSVLNRPEAKAETGMWNEQFLEQLNWDLVEIYDIVHRLRPKYCSPDPALKGTPQRCCLGNMRFGEGSILAETERHAEYRLKKAKEQREKRQKTKREEKRRARRKQASPNNPSKGGTVADDPEY